MCGYKRFSKYLYSILKLLQNKMTRKCLFLELICIFNLEKKATNLLTSDINIDNIPKFCLINLSKVCLKIQVFT